MNIINITKAVGVIAAKIAQVGATQTAIQNLQQKNRKDIDEFNKGDYNPNLKLVTKEDLKNAVPKKENMKQGFKNVGMGAAKIMKVGVQTQTIHSLNELNRDEMKYIDGKIRRGYKYNVSPKLQEIKKIKIGRE